MSGVRFLSTVVAIFITFLWAGYVVNAYQKNAALRQLAQTQTDTTSQNNVAEMNKGEDQAKRADDQGQGSSKDEISSNAKVSASKGEVEVAKVDDGIDPAVARADEMARAASEEFTKHIKEADAKVLKVPAEKIEEKQKVAAVKDVPAKKDSIAQEAPQEKITQAEASEKVAAKEETVAQAEKSVSDAKSDGEPQVQVSSAESFHSADIPIKIRAAFQSIATLHIFVFGYNRLSN